MLLVPPDLSGTYRHYNPSIYILEFLFWQCVSPLAGWSSRHCKTPQWERAAVCSKPFPETPGSLQLAIQTFVGFTYCSKKQHKARCDCPQVSMLLLVLLLLANGVESSKSKALDHSLLSTEPVQSLYFLNSTVKLCLTIWFERAHKLLPAHWIDSQLAALPSLAPNNKTPTCFKCTCWLNGHNSTESGSSGLSLKSDRPLGPAGISGLFS